MQPVPKAASCQSWVVNDKGKDTEDKCSGIPELLLGLISCAYAPCCVLCAVCVLVEHCRTVKGIIFVVDSSERLRMATAKDELERLLTHKGRLTLCCGAALAMPGVSNVTPRHLDTSIPHTHTHARVCSLAC